MKDFILIVTSLDGQAAITRKCLDSIKSKGRYDIFLINCGEKDPNMKKLGKSVSYYKEYPSHTPIALEWKETFLKARKKAHIIGVCNNDIQIHPQANDAVISIFKNTDLTTLSGDIVTDEQKLHDFKLDKNLNLYYRNVFLGPNRYKSWLPIFKDDYGFDIYSYTWWRDEFFDTVGYPDDTTFCKGIYLQDTDYQYRAALKGVDLYVASSVLYYHHCGFTHKTRTPADRARMDKLYQQMLQRYSDKWGGPLHRIQHNELYVTPFQSSLSSKELYKRSVQPTSEYYKHKEGEGLNGTKK